MKRHLFAAALALAGAGATAADEAATQFSFMPPQPDAGTSVRIDVSGRWPDGCSPTLREARVDGRDILLTAELASPRCAGKAHRYQTGTAALEGGRLQLPGRGIYRVRYEVRRTPDALPELHGFRLLYVGSEQDPGFVPEAGFWWPERGGEFDRGGPGLGLQMEVQARMLSLSVYGYDEQGRDRWWLGAGPLQGHVAQVELTRLGAGGGPFDAYSAPRELLAAGTLHVELISPSRATLWFVRPLDADRGIEARPMSVVRFRFAQDAADAWLGRWVVLAEREDGYPTLRIDFARVERSESGFVLADAGGEHALACEQATTRPNSPPLRCRLTSKTGDLLDVDFEHVALNEMRGWTGAGQRIVALKLNR